MPTLTKQEALFFDRVALKMQGDPRLSIEDAAKQVLDDDQRIFETVVIMRDDARKEFISSLSSQTYHALRNRKDSHA